MQNHGGWGEWDGPGGRRPDIGVLRSDDHGRTCRSIARGLSRKESFFTVQRDGMDIDHLKTPAHYFGTTTGQLWIGREGGESWECLFDSLPPIHSVKVAIA